MAVNEKIQTGRKFRKLIDEDSRLQLRISFWTKAGDVEFDDGETAESKLSNMENRINGIVTSFQDGVNKIYNKLKGLGFTPAANSPDGICQAIQTIHDTRYTNGYNAGRLQGQEDVKTNPGSFGVSTGIAPEQFTLYMSRSDFDYGEVPLIAPHNGTCYLKFEGYVSYNSAHNANGLSLTVSRNGNAIAAARGIDDGIDVSNGGEKGWRKTLTLPGCTAGETLILTFHHKNGNASWINGIY